ncbi:hypothetical protein BDQ12DRAFT_692878, partial [Crucibulum laeve]
SVICSSKLALFKSRAIASSIFIPSSSMELFLVRTLMLGFLLVMRISPVLFEGRYFLTIFGSPSALS